MDAERRARVEALAEQLCGDVRELSLGTCGEVERIHGAPSPLRFLRDFVLPNKPCIISHAIDHWPALRAWTNSYLRSALQHQIVSVHLTPDGRADSVVDLHRMESIYGCRIADRDASTGHKGCSCGIANPDASIRHKGRGCGIADRDASIGHNGQSCGIADRDASTTHKECSCGIVPHIESMPSSEDPPPSHDRTVHCSTARNPTHDGGAHWTDLHEYHGNSQGLLQLQNTSGNEEVLIPSDPSDVRHMCTDVHGPVTCDQLETSQVMYPLGGHLCSSVKHNDRAENEGQLIDLLGTCQCAWTRGSSSCDIVSDVSGNGEPDHLWFVTAHVESLPFPTALDMILKSDQGSGVAYAQEQNGCFLTEYSTLTADAETHLPWATDALGCMPEAVNFWIGTEKAVTSFHKDHYENLYAVVAGEKHFTLLPPTDVHRLYVRDYPSAHYTRVNGKFVIERDRPLNSIPWVSVDPYPPPKNSSQALLQFPRYFKGPDPFTCTVRSGEILYLPSMWFHHVRQSPDLEGRTIAVNYWYDMQFDIKYAYYKFLESVVYKA